MAAYSIDSDLKGAFKINIDQVRELSRIISQYSLKPPSITIQFVNGHQISSDNVDDLAGDPILRSRRIKSISLSTGFGPETRVSVRMSTKTMLPPVDIDISGTKDQCVGSNRDIGEFFEQIRMRHGSIYKFPILAMIFCVLTGIFLTWKVDPVSKEIDPNFVGITMTGVVLFIASKIRDILLPAMQFDIGRGSEDYKLRYEVVKWIALTAVAGTLLATGVKFFSQRL
jgi:hypothetical protein